MTREEAIKILQDYPNCTVGQLSKVPVKAVLEFMEAIPHWISVEERLPEKDNEFEDYSKHVVVTDGKDFYKGMYNYGGACWLTHDLWPIEDATHWMEVQLPQPPRKEE